MATLGDIAYMALSLLKAHGLDDWAFAYDRAKSRAGSCMPSTKTITLSRNLEGQPLPQVRNIVLHEIAHALVGAEHGHDNVWKAKAIEIGCDGMRCHQMHMVEHTWTLTCPCGHVHLRRHLVRRGAFDQRVCSVCMGAIKAVNDLTGATVEYSRDRRQFKWVIRCACGANRVERQAVHRSLLRKTCAICSSNLSAHPLV